MEELMTGTEIRIPRRKLKALVNDNVKSAEAVNLVYVSDTQPGISRSKGKSGFVYKMGGKTVTDAQELFRIRQLVIPPAWEKVWICPDPNGHLQVTGYDVKGRKQYRYHPLWNALRNHTKYFNLQDFGKALPAIRQQLKKHLAMQGLPQEKVLALVVSLMQCTCIRIGSNIYEKLNGSFGLTTLKDQHVQIKGTSLKFSFKGKKGVYHDITLKNKKLARLVQACRDIPGKELFQYYDDSGTRRAIDSGMVNAYIKDISGGNFTAKDFRTWAGSLQALQAFRELGGPDEETGIKKRIVEVLDIVAKQLGNTRTVCKKYYVHPSIIDLFTEGKLQAFFPADARESACVPDEAALTEEEEILMKILVKHGNAISVQ